MKILARISNYEHQTLIERIGKIETSFSAPILEHNLSSVQFNSLSLYFAFRRISQFRYFMYMSNEPEIGGVNVPRLFRFKLCGVDRSRHLTSIQSFKFSDCITG